MLQVKKNITFFYQKKKKNAEKIYPSAFQATREAAKPKKIASITSKQNNTFLHILFFFVGRYVFAQPDPNPHSKWESGY
jgi:hypothetical protein